MQSITSKELDYLADSLTNEDLLVKQAANAITHAQNPAIRQIAEHLIQSHQQHYAQILSALQQHAQVAPNQPQQQ
ncbi:hypothetical protein [Paenibacillus chitinolyticus]|uniref:hypothetical protein n=1 Tax=Paenibacillus chitinolyticus TaxID=79263 RepID=UPI003650C620